MVDTKWLQFLNCKIRCNIFNLTTELQDYFVIGSVLTNMLLNVPLLFCPLYQELPFKPFLLYVIVQVQIYELEEHKIETWRGENI